MGLDVRERKRSSDWASNWFITKIDMNEKILNSTDLFWISLWKDRAVARKNCQKIMDKISQCLEFRRIS